MKTKRLVQLMFGVLLLIAISTGLVAAPVSLASWGGDNAPVPGDRGPNEPGAPWNGRPKDAGPSVLASWGGDNAPVPGDRGPNEPGAPWNAA